MLSSKMTLIIFNLSLHEYYLFFVKQNSSLFSNETIEKILDFLRVFFS